MHFLSTNSRLFSLSTFIWSNWERTCWNQSFCFLEGAHDRRFPSNLTVYTASPSLDEHWPLVWLVVVHFSCPMISSIPHSCTVSTFHHSSQFVLKLERFCYISGRELQWKYCQEGFFYST